MMVHYVARTITHCPVGPLMRGNMPPKLTTWCLGDSPSAPPTRSVGYALSAAKQRGRAGRGRGGCHGNLFRQALSLERH